MLMFMLTRKVDARITKTDELLLKINFNIFALVLNEDKLKKKGIPNIQRTARNLKGILRSAEYLISKSKIVFFKHKISDLTQMNVPFLYSAYSHATVRLFISYLEKKSRKVVFHKDVIYDSKESSAPFIDLSIHFSLYHAIISALILLYYIVKNNVKRALKNV